MFRLHWLQVRGATRGMPRRGPGHRKQWPALGLVVCLAVLQSGCQSGPFSNCGGGCGSGSGLFSPCGFFGRVSSRVFTRSSRSAGCCESGVVSGAPMEYPAPTTVAPSTVITSPSTSAVPSYQAMPGSVSPPSSVPPLPDTPTEMNPIETTPKSRVVPGPSSGTSSASPSGKISYQTRRVDPSSRLARRPVNLSRTQVATPVPTPRSAQALSGPRPKSSATPDNDDALDHLPPLDLPGEVTRSAATPPVPPAADRAAKQGENATKKLDARREPPAPAADDLDLTSATTPITEPGTSASAGPGINRFVAVDLKLAGGGAPSVDGLKWLVDKGYRTVLDLRESSEVPASFIADVTRMGLRYVALPISLTTIDRDHVDRFNFEMAAGEARPLFFFDSDGTRAGALWYIRRVANDRVDHQIARREAQELGLTNASYWSAATTYVEKLSHPQAATTSQSLPAIATDATPPIKTASLNQKSEAASPAQRATVAAVIIDDKPGSLPSFLSASHATESVAWRPFAAMVVTGLSVPLAYWSRTLPTAVLAKVRASLPGSVHGPRSLPVESGV
jgi:protein tyrosine phosphatase (PTP) superfamily phosphohydrolase (DUF442 family)